MGRPSKEVSQEKIQRFQIELELAGKDADLLLKDKKGRSRSCLLCQRRKQKCDHKIPSCTACLKAAVRCIQPAKYGSSAGYNSHGSGDGGVPRQRDNSMDLETRGIKQWSEAKIGDVKPGGFTANQKVPATKDDSDKKSTVGNGDTKNAKSGKDEYTLFLEKKLVYLEKLLNLSPDSMSYKNKLANYKMISQFLQTENMTKYEELLFSQNHRDHIALEDATPSTKQQSVPYSKDGDVFFTNLPRILGSVECSKSFLMKYNLKDFILVEPILELEEAQSRTFLETYFTKIQFKYPLLEEEEIYQCHTEYVLKNRPSRSTAEFHFICGRMWLVFSLAASLNMGNGKDSGALPGRCFSTALRHIIHCGANLTYVQKVETMTLLVLYLIRTDRDSAGLYEIIKDAIDLCKNKLHLHKKQSGDVFANKKLRLFWSVYLLERMICVALGRPYTISESEIELPVFDEDIFKPNNTNYNIKSKPNVHFINQSIHLRRLESKFVETLQIIPQSADAEGKAQLSREKLSQDFPLVSSFFRDLETWVSNCPSSKIRSYEFETLEFYYFRSLRLLVQPYLELLDPNDRLFRACQHAAGQICQKYKMFHQKSMYGSSTPAVHNVFVAGVTLIYCMWLTKNHDDEYCRRLGGDYKHTRPLATASLFTTMDALKACSVCLYVMAERSQFAILFRDTFDQLVNVTIGNLIERCGPDSSGLTYIAPSASHHERNRYSSQAEATSANSSTAIVSGNIKREIERLPSAMTGTFANVHVGHNTSQPEVEDQNTSKRKRNILQMAQVPKSLSQLMTNVASGKLTGFQNLSDDSQKHPVIKEELNNQTLFHESHPQYTVKKSATPTELDREVFEQQGLFQQRCVKKNIQPYLSTSHSCNPCGSFPHIPVGNSLKRRRSLGPTKKDNEGTHRNNDDKTTRQDVNDDKKNNRITKFNINTEMKENNNTSIKNDTIKTGNGNNNGYPPKKPREGPPPNKSHEHQVLIHQQGHQQSQQQQASSFDNYIGEHVTSTVLNGTDQRIHSGPAINAMFQPTLEPLSSQNPGNNGIAFNNGTHNMINNISAWTSDYVIDFLNNPKGMVPLATHQRLHSQDSSSASNPTNIQHTHQKIAPISNRDNSSHAPSAGQWRSPSSLTEPGAENSWHQGQHHSGQHGAQHQANIDAFWNVSIEDFWTGNDDYDFLT
ncbi:HHR110Cp [Eremothecium sinecaudum]|uniref:HHR110Cp n=1 Tax=Eremothecium sinecaudum TaxID=45286 RepID=A0A0X8HWP5_9SACH|nr:HHR110Cp [Eremothecium sinecaudum]AMD22879.1 HHR110Cp [Eremothecium sinecaudum]